MALTPEELKERRRKASREYRRKRYATPEGREIILAANRASNKTPERLERDRQRDRQRRRPENLTPEQLDRHREMSRIKARRWYRKPESKAKIRKQSTTKYATDPLFKLPRVLRVRLYKSLKRASKSGSAVRALGCSIKEFKAYIEARFTPGMSWNNWSPTGWHLDHIRPIAMYNLADPDEILAAFHYSNYQPLWAPENHAKGARYADPSPSVDH